MEYHKETPSFREREPIQAGGRLDEAEEHGGAAPPEGELNWSSKKSANGVLSEQRWVHQVVKKEGEDRGMVEATILESQFMSLVERQGRYSSYLRGNASSWFHYEHRDRGPPLYPSSGDARRDLCGQPT